MVQNITYIVSLSSQIPCLPHALPSPSNGMALSDAVHVLLFLPSISVKCFLYPCKFNDQYLTTVWSESTFEFESATCPTMGRAGLVSP